VFKDNMSNVISSAVKRIVSKVMALGFHRSSVRVLPHDVLESLRDRLLDLVFRELNERSRRMKAFGPYGFLLWRELEFLVGVIWHRPNLIR
jgi:hypothetical protein